MTGELIHVVPKRALDFASLAVGGSQQVILADRIPVLSWRTVTLMIRAHSHTLTGGNTVAVQLFPQSWTPEEPGLQFVGTTGLGGTITSSTPSPGLLETTIVTTTSALPALVRVVCVANRAVAGTMQASLSLDVVMQNG